MLSRNDFIQESLGTHLFFARIMKEHSFFLQVGFTPRDDKYIKRAEELKLEFEALLGDAIALSDGVISPDYLESGEIITQYTLEAEKATQYYTGVLFPVQLTEAAAGLGACREQVDRSLDRAVAALNHRALALIENIIQFKNNVLSNVLGCKMYTTNYPLLLEHILREARFYQYLIRRLQGREEINFQREAYEQEFFWNRIMAEHSKFIRGLLDPSEEDLFKTAYDFGNEFDRLTTAAKEAMDMGRSGGRTNITEESLRATIQLRDFKAQGTEGILDCKVKSIIIPLLSDHTLREANHYLRLLKMFSHS